MVRVGRIKKKKEQDTLPLSYLQRARNTEKKIKVEKIILKFVNDLMWSHGFNCWLFNEQHTPQCNYIVCLTPGTYELIKGKDTAFYPVSPLSR